MVGFGVGVSVAVGAAVGVAVGRSVAVGSRVGVAVGAAVGVGVGVGAGLQAANTRAKATALPSLRTEVRFCQFIFDIQAPQLLARWRWHGRRARVGRRAGCQFVSLQEEMLIGIVSTNPKPSDRIAFENTNSTIATRYSYRPDIFFAVDALKVQRGVERILCPQAVGFSRPASDSLIQMRVGRPKRWQGCRFHNWS